MLAANTRSPVCTMLIRPVNLLRKLIRQGRSSSASETNQDTRSRRWVAVIDCILNQNSRDAGSARFAALNFEWLQICHEHGVGILQMPCPEILALGFKRQRPPGTSIRQALESESGRRCCAGLASEVADRIESCLADDCTLLAILGGNPGSPGCAVIAGQNGLHDDSGVFMRALQEALSRRGKIVVFKAIRDCDPEWLDQDLQWLRDLLACRPDLAGDSRGG